MKNKSQKMDKKNMIFPEIHFSLLIIYFITQIFFIVSSRNVKLIPGILIAFIFFIFFSVISRIIHNKFRNAPLPKRKLEIFYIIVFYVIGILLMIATLFYWPALENIFKKF